MWTLKKRVAFIGGIVLFTFTAFLMVGTNLVHIDEVESTKMVKDEVDKDAFQRDHQNKKRTQEQKHVIDSGNSENKATPPNDVIDTRTTKKEGAHCTPSTNLVYIKVHKTGSSTLQNIFYRFGDERDLTFALPRQGYYIEGIGQFKPSSILRPPPRKNYNILANHARFFYNDMKKLMPPDTKFVTLIREASSHFTSMYSYFVLKRTYKVDLEQFSLNPKRYYDQFNKDKLTRWSGKDPELFDLGINKQDLYNREKIEEYIEFLDSKMDLVLISEHFFESLILLKEHMCWDLRTLVHLNSKLRVYYKGKPPTTDEKGMALKKRLNEWNSGDNSLYDHFNRTLWRKIDAYGRLKMAAEIAELKRMCQQYQDECMSGTKVRDISNWSGPYGVTEYVLRKDKEQNKTCVRLGMSEPEFVPYLRKKHNARLEKT